MPSTRTPEGEPSRCALCGAENAIDFSSAEFSLAGGDAPCPGCGCLLVRSSQIARRLRETLATTLGVASTEVIDSMRLIDLGADSLTMAEFAMMLDEEAAGGDSEQPIKLPDDAITEQTTFGDLVRSVVAGAEA